MTPLHERIAAAERKHGQRQGDPIPGSDRVRAYCCECLREVAENSARLTNCLSEAWRYLCSPAARGR